MASLTHKVETAVYSAGYITGRIDDFIDGYMKAGNQALLAVLLEMREMQYVVAVTLDELIVENTELRNKLANVQNALS